MTNFAGRTRDEPLSPREWASSKDTSGQKTEPEGLISWRIEMVQAKLTGYAPRAMRTRNGRTWTREPAAYVASLRGASRGIRIEIAVLDRIRPLMSAGGSRGRQIKMLRYGQLAAERTSDILGILRGRAGRAFAQDVYGVFVQRSAERGRSIITWRRFGQILEILESNGRVRREVRSFGRYGRRTIVIRTPGFRGRRDCE